MTRYKPFSQRSAEEHAELCASMPRECSDMPHSCTGTEAGSHNDDAEAYTLDMAARQGYNPNR